MVTDRASQRPRKQDAIFDRGVPHLNKILAVSLAMLVVGTCPARAEDADASKPPEWRVGVASAKITPEQRLHMAGYAARKAPAEGTQQELYGKAMAIEDQAGSRVVFVTLDLVGVREELRSQVAAQVQEQFKLAPRNLLMNASHTHCGPSYEKEDAKDYFDSLVTTLVDLVGRSLEQLEPANLSYSFASCSVAINRRTPTDSGFINHPNPNGPVDHTVPVLSVHNPDDETLRAVLFGYACHNTTLGILRWQGDYAGYAQEYLERDHPGVTALFMMGCGGDQNPYPRRDIKYVQRHGQALATAVDAALEVDQRTPRHQHPIHGLLSVAYETVDLELTQPDGPAIWVAGYSNTYAGYIPSRRVLGEGGYEAISRPWKPSLENRIVGKVNELVGQLSDSE